jgi:predicted MPP superfamily phosphohydrolase
MPKLLWMSDIHLNFLSEPDIAEFVGGVTRTPHDGILVGGDIAECHSFGPILRALAEQTAAPVWFVLGNHDAYHGSLATARQTAATLASEVENLHWLDEAGIFELNAETGLLGHSCWGDGRNGNAHDSEAMLNDWLVIDELVGLRDEERVQRLAELGAAAADHLRGLLPEALERYPHVIVLTHVPPFADVNMRGDLPMLPDYLPFYTCGAVGELLHEAMVARPQRRMTVLSGHTHGGGRYPILPNLTAWTLGTQYGEPRYVQAPLAPDATLDVPG